MADITKFFKFLFLPDTSIPDECIEIDTSVNYSFPLGSKHLINKMNELHNTRLKLLMNDKKLTNYRNYTKNLYNMNRKLIHANQTLMARREQNELLIDVSIFLLAIILLILIF